MTADESTHPDTLSEPTKAEFSVEVVSDLSSLAGDWQRIEACAPVSPYQRFDFIAAWVHHAAEGDRVEPAVGVARSATGEAFAILPFGIRRHGQFSTAIYLGGSHVNFNLPLIDPSKTLSKSDIQHLVRLYCEAAGVDRLYLESQPRQWLGQDHPFLLFSSFEAPCPAWHMTLHTDAEALVGEHLSKDFRAKNSRKLRRLRECDGFRLLSSDTKENRNLLMDAYLRQKAVRLRQIGVDDPFSAPGINAFLRDATQGPNGCEGFSWIGLEVEGQILAVLGGVQHRGQFSLNVMSFDINSVHAKQSPGEILLQILIERLAVEGITHLDFGVGHARYKEIWSDGTIPMFDCSYAVTPMGYAASRVARARTALARTVKTNERLYGAVKSARAWLARHRA